MAENEPLTIRPQPGPQEQFLASPADICIYGGAAGGGKSYGLLLEPIRHINNPKFRGVIFRRTTPEITKPGGLWDEAVGIYSHFGQDRRESPQHEIKFPKGGTLSFAHLQYEDTKYDWRGAQLAFEGWDQLETFTEGQFFYLLSRNRTDSGIAPYVRATCNPDPDSWIAGFLSWWIDQETGLAIPERSGKMRWMLRVEEKIEWADSKEELKAKYPGPDTIPLSVMFIKSEYTDNPINLARNPNYVGWLNGMNLVDRERLKHGNWKIRASAGTMFRSDWFPIVAAAPKGIIRIRFWDRAATAKTAHNNPDWTAGVLLIKDKYNQFFVEDLKYFQGTALDVENAMAITAEQDGSEVIVGQYQDPGQAGVDQAKGMVRKLAGFRVKTVKEDRENNKVKAAGPISAQAEAGNIKLVRGPWNKDFISNHVNFPDEKHDDIVAAMIGAFRIAIKPQSWGSGEC